MTPTSVLVSWTAWGGTQPMFYITNHRVTGNSAWIPNPLGLTLGLNQAITGLTGATGYDVRLQGSNNAGVAFSAVFTFTTPAGGVIFRDVVIPAEFGGPRVISQNVAVPVEFRLSTFTVTRDLTVLAEWTGNTGVTGNAAVPLEFRLGTTFFRDAAVPLEWTGPTGVFRDFTVPVDIIPTPLAPPLQVQNLALSAPTTTTLLSTWDDLITGPSVQGYTMEWKRTTDPATSFLVIVPSVAEPVTPFVVSRTSLVPLEYGGHVTTVRNTDVPVEWSGGKGASRDFAMPIEFGGSTVRIVDAAVPLEFRGTTTNVTRDFTIPIERKATTRRDAIIGTDFRAIAPSPAPSAFYVEIDLGDGSTLTDPVSGITWGLANQNGGIATANSIPNAASAPCNILVRTFSPNVIWIRDASNTLLWRSWTGSAWVPAAGTSDPRFTNTPPGAVVSLALGAVTSTSVALTWDFPTGTVIGGGFRARFKRTVDALYGSDTIIPCVGPSVGQFTDSASRTFSINSAGRVVVNGTADLNTSSAALLLLIGTAYWYQQTGGTWFTKALFTSPWTSAGTADPLGITFTGLTTTTNDYNFQVVAFNIAGDGPVSTVTETSASADGTRIPPATQIIDAQNRTWTLVNGQEVVNGVPVADTSGVLEMLYFGGSVYQRTSFSWWGPSSPSTGGAQLPGDPSAGSSIPVPAPAAAAGFNTLAFNDDFTTSTTIAPAYDTASGYNWYWGLTPGFDATTYWSVNTSGSGILTLTGPRQPNDALISIPGWAMNNTGSSTVPTVGAYSHAYFEARIQFDPLGNGGNTDETRGWPAWWLWTVQGIGNFGFSGTTGALNPGNATEIDIMESYGTLFQNPGANWGSAVHDWPNNDSDSLTQVPGSPNSAFHTYGCLWEITGAGTGRLRFYFDNVLVAGTTAPTGAGTLHPNLESRKVYMILGTGIQPWPMQVDYVRVWTV